MHKKNKRSLVEKRASSQRVCFVAVDHGLDMELKAISNNVIDTFGGCKSPTSSLVPSSRLTDSFRWGIDKSVALADFDDVSPYFFSRSFIS